LDVGVMVGSEEVTEKDFEASLGVLVEEGDIKAIFPAYAEAKKGTYSHLVRQLEDAMSRALESCSRSEAAGQLSYLLAQEGVPKAACEAAIRICGENNWFGPVDALILNKNASEDALIGAAAMLGRAGQAKMVMRIRSRENATSALLEQTEQSLMDVVDYCDRTNSKHQVSYLLREPDVPGRVLEKAIDLCDTKGWMDAIEGVFIRNGIGEGAPAAEGRADSPASAGSGIIAVQTYAISAWELNGQVARIISLFGGEDILPTISAAAEVSLSNILSRCEQESGSNRVLRPFIEMEGVPDRLLESAIIFWDGEEGAEPVAGVLMREPLPSDGVLLAAIQVCGEAGEPEGPASLIRREGISDEVAIAAIWVCTECSELGAVEELFSRERLPSEKVLLAAIEACIGEGIEDAMEPLFTRSELPSEKVLLAAIDACEGEDGEKVLKPMLQRDDLPESAREAIIKKTEKRSPATLLMAFVKTGGDVLKPAKSIPGPKKGKVGGGGGGKLRQRILR
jgi:SOS response regulatory protein OraA/RecX